MVFKSQYSLEGELCKRYLAQLKLQLVLSYFSYSFFFFFFEERLLIGRRCMGVLHLQVRCVWDEVGTVSSKVFGSICFTNLRRADAVAITPGNP